MYYKHYLGQYTASTYLPFAQHWVLAFMWILQYFDTYHLSKRTKYTPYGNGITEWVYPLLEG